VREAMQGFTRVSRKKLLAGKAFSIPLEDRNALPGDCRGAYTESVCDQRYSWTGKLEFKPLR